MPTRHSYRVPLVIFCLLTALYLLTASGHLYSPDEETMYAVTRQIALAGDVAVGGPEAGPYAALRPGADGRPYAPYGILTSLAALPFFWLGTLAAPEGTLAFGDATRFMVSLMNAPVTAATAALLASWALRLGSGRAWATVVALLFGLGSFAWPYARTFFSEPLTGLLLVLAAERAHAARTAVRPGSILLVSGLAAGLLVATRVASGIALPLLALYVAWPVHGWRGSILRLAWWGAGLFPGLALIAGYNWLRFATLSEAGYGSEAELFITPLAVGLYGLLLSPGKGLIWYAPAMLLVFAGAWQLRRHQPGLIALIGGVALAHVLLYARWHAWEGGGVWGPRLILPVVPLLLVLVASLGTREAPAGQQDGPPRRSWPLTATRLLAVPLGALGLAGALAGVLVNFDLYVNMPVEPERKLYAVADSPLLAHWRIVGERFARHWPGQPHCALAEGYYAPHPENPGDVLPRRTGATATLRCRLEQPAVLTLWLIDWTPTGLPHVQTALDIHETVVPVPVTEIFLPARLYIPAGETDVVLVSTRPGGPPEGERLGVVLANARVGGGAAAPGIIDAAIAPVPEDPVGRWAWYYDLFNMHLVDHWAWYLPRLGLPPDTYRALTGGLLSAAAIFVVAGIGVLVRQRVAVRAPA